ncbi:MAG TPA: glycosyltransferase family 4 protein [Terriglobales bacterium]|nr:glycosyltransferase family 4 protein [Terriglobales bacterium]
MTMRVAALTTGLQTPSSRFRIRQHIAPLAEHGILVREFMPVVGDNVDNLLRPLRPKGTRIRNFPLIYPLYFGLLALRLAARLPGVAASWRYDLTWLERGLCGGWPTLERLLGKPLVLDVDDAVWLAQPFGAKQMQRTAERADVVVVCNSYLADWFGRFCRRVELVPTPVDGDIFFPIAKPEDSAFIVGWTGTSANFPYLASIRQALAKFLHHAPEARLRIVAENPPADLGLPPERVEFVRWSAANEAAAVQTMDVGIMPLADDAWTRGKCAFKLIQYMACGLPVVASPVGMTAEVLGRGNVGLTARNDAQWLDALIFLYEQRDKAKSLGTAGRTKFLEHYSRGAATRQLAEIFNSTR